ncbi:MAG: HEAT repeat domain-containing protein [Planctomycetota bacterium]|jgi:HEAT repeat protein
MTLRFLAVLFGTGLLWALTATPALAHGGQFTGSQFIVLPDPAKGSTPSPPAPAPAPARPTTPGPTAPSAPAPSGPSSGDGSKTGGVTLSEDLSRWQFWWELNRDPFLMLKDAIHTRGAISGGDEIFVGPTRRGDTLPALKPSDRQIQKTILPALKQALGTGNRDITTACLMALAKIGRDHDSFRLRPVLKRFLDTHDQEVRETAALALGVSTQPAAALDLIHLVLDTGAGRALLGGRKVDHRTRSFAAYGLGLVAHANATLHLKRSVFETMKAVLADRHIVDRNIRVAAIEALSLLNIDTQSAGGADQKLLLDSLAVLMDYYERKLGRGAELIQSHVPTAVAKLLGRGRTPLHQQYKDRFAADLAPRQKKSHDIHRAAVLALGQLTTPHGDDAGYSRLLLDYYHRGRDAQARYFALIALAQIGGTDNRNALLKVLARGQKNLEKPWAALALGILAFEARKQGEDRAAVETVGHELLQQFRKARSPYARGAMAVGLGLCGHRPAGRELREQFSSSKHQDEFAGYLCIGMSLIPYRRAQPDMLEVAKHSVRRPTLLTQVAVALGKMGHKGVTPALIHMLQDRRGVNLAKMSAISQALAYVGDRSTVTPLRDMLLDERLTPLTRAFAAVALGGIADKEKLPWNSKIGRNMNYRAAVETLIQSGNGILEIL